MKKLCLILAIMMLTPLFASSYVASTSWVAGFMDLAGLDNITVIAPATLRHPPEYELVPSDIVTLMNADVFCYAGYEQMMNTISSSITSDKRIDLRISTSNNLDNVIEEVMKITAVTETEPRLDEYIAVIEHGRAVVEEKSLSSLRVLCHQMQQPLATDLGLNVVATFGSGAMTSAQILDAAEGDYDLIIDNIHNPVAGPAAEVSDAVLIIWRNFPDEIGSGAFTAMVRENIEKLDAAF